MLGARGMPPITQQVATVEPRSAPKRLVVVISVLLGEAYRESKEKQGARGTDISGGPD